MVQAGTAKRLSNGWTDESSQSTPPQPPLMMPQVPLMMPGLPAGLAPSKPTSESTCRRAQGVPAADGAAPAPSTLTLGGVKVRVPQWLPAWWEDFTADKAVMVEVISRAVFPLLFFIFNVIYWPWYLMWTALAVLRTVVSQRRGTRLSALVKFFVQYYLQAESWLRRPKQIRQGKQVSDLCNL